MIPVNRFRSGETAFSTYSGLSQPVRRVIRDSSDWRSLWDEIHRPFMPRPALPPIDFSKEMVIVAALGSRPSGGFDIAIESVNREAGGLEVSLRTKTPAPGCPVEAVVTQPVDLARIPRTTDSVRFRDLDVAIPCSAR